MSGAAPKLGGCRLERVLSNSEHSELYRAFSEELQRQVMIKVLAPRYPSASRTARRFLRGGTLAAELEHPNIVRTFSAGEDRGRPYMLMEFLDGHSLDRILKVREKVGWEVATGIVRQVAKALDAAQQRNVVHRAVEPSHIMLSPGGRATVLGFGLARLAEAQDARITAEGALVNIGPYSPPETGEGILDIRGDLYSLGCVYFHLLTGKPPFEGGDPLFMLHQHRTVSHWPAIDLVPELPPALDEVVTLLLEKDLARRLARPAELIALIDAAVNPEVLGSQGVKPDKTLVTSTMSLLAVREKLTALVCDSHDRTLRSLAEALRRTGLGVLAARDGRAAVETLKSRDIALLVTDTKVPGLWGRQLLEQARQARPAMPVLLTRRGPQADAFYMNRDLGVAGCLARPLDYQELRRAVRKALGW